MISICIPTFNRPELLVEALGSCFAQGYRPIEILVGDDSSNTDAERILASVAMPDGVDLRYERNSPQLGQAGNVNRLFDRAKGDRLALLHDDDMFCDCGLDRLVSAWDATPNAICVYGVQVIADSSGTPLPERTADWSKRYLREPAYRGAKLSPLVAAVRQQVPNDGFLIDSALARATRLRDESIVGQCVDAEFMIRLASLAPPGLFVFVDEPISVYRLTPASIARSGDLNRREDLFFESVVSLSGDGLVEEAKTVLLRRISVGAALDAALAGRRSHAIDILLSRHYTLSFLDLRTLYRLACILSPRWARWLRGLIRGGKIPPKLRESTHV